MIEEYEDIPMDWHECEHRLPSGKKPCNAVEMVRGKLYCTICKRRHDPENVGVEYTGTAFKRLASR
jgi:hypothetical protein